MARGRGWIGWATLVAVLLAPTGANAATQIGQTASPSVTCGDAISWVQTKSAVEYRVPPEGGVITAWSHRGGDVAGSVRLKVLRDGVFPNQFVTVGNSALKTVPANTLVTTPAQIRVNGGDVLGLYTDGKQQPCGSDESNGEVLRTSGNVQLGTTHTYANQRAFRLDIAATVEPDADSDGLGDESQDPTPPPPAPSPPSGGGGGGGPGEEQPPPAAPPKLALLLVAPASFSAANLGRSIFARVGARVTYVLTEPATVTFGVQRQLAGRRVNRRCVRPTRSNRLRARCVRFVARRGSFTHFGTSIVNRFVFTGRIGGRALPVGRYRIVAQAANVAGAKSGVVRAAFRIVRQP